MTYDGILFSYNRTFKEIDLAKHYFGRYIAAESSSALGEWLGKLKQFKQTAIKGNRYTWEIPVTRPLKTIVSEGQYQPDNAGGLRVRGTLSAIWTIEHVGRHTVLGKGDEAFRLVDLGSTLVQILRIIEGEPDGCVAAWRFDIGVANSPGFHFHTQVPTRPDSSNAVDEVYFPLALDVPRFPAILFFPLDGLEFLLGELFHEDWPRYAASQDSRLGFSEHQTGRLRGLLAGWGFTTTKAIPPLTVLRDHKPLANCLLLH